MRVELICMRLRPAVLAAVTALLAAGAVVLPAHAEPTYGQAKVSYDVPTRSGHLYLEVVHPTLGGKIVKAPVILTSSPYNAAFGRNGDAKSWVPSGYARAYVDVVGTGNSGGCFDYGGMAERTANYDTVEWIARQGWSTGRIAMTGGSYDGTTAMGAATLRPPHLVTIVPEAAISRWYDYAYSGGIRYTFNDERNGHEDPGVIIDEQGFDTPIGFDLGFAIPPPTDVGGDGWQERVTSTITPCDELEHIQSGYALDPDYDAFWQARDYARVADQVKIPVLVSHNWGDWNVKQATGVLFWEKAVHSSVRRLYMGNRWEGHGTPSGGYPSFKHAWMDHWLKGVDNGVESSPEVVSQTSDRKGKLDFRSGPVPRTQPLRLYAGAGQQLTTTPAKASADAQYVATGAGTESAWLAAPSTTPGAAWFVSPPLARDVRMFGAARATLLSHTDRSWLQQAVSLVDVDPAAYNAAGTANETLAMLGVTRGWLDTRYRFGNEKRVPFPAGGGASAVDLKPMDYVFRAGHRIAVLVTDVELEWTVSKPYDGAGSPVVGLATAGQTRIDLPVIGATQGLFRKQ